MRNPYHELVETARTTNDPFCVSSAILARDSFAIGARDAAAGHARLCEVALGERKVRAYRAIARAECQLLLERMARYVAADVLPIC